MTARAFVVTRCADETRLGEILKIVHTAFGSLTPPSGALDETLADVEARYKAGPILLARAGEQLIGSVFCTLNGGGLYLTRMAVLPEWQRRGVGRALLAAAEQEARALGAGKLMLRVRANLPDNRRYFESHGFRVTGQGQDPGRPPYDAMERPVAAAPPR